MREACINELKHGPQVVNEVARTIDEFAKFCVLLAKPENHIEVRTGQYVERQVRERAEIDMVNEAARLSSSIAPYTAYVRLEKRQSEAGAWIGKVRTEALAGVAADALTIAQRDIKDNVYRYTRTREEIREEIRKRQEPWRQRVKAPSVRIVEKQKAPASEQRMSEPEEPLPPTSITEELKGGEADTRETDKEEKAKEKKVREDEASRTQGRFAGAVSAVPEQQADQESGRGGSDRPREAIRVTESHPQSVIGESLPQTTRMRLIYQSDFTQPTGWDEGHSDKVKVFRLDGYYHIAVYDGPYSAWFNPALLLDDFKAQVYVELNIQSGKTADCGMVFCAEDGNPNGTFFCYSFTVSRNGFYLSARPLKKGRERRGGALGTSGEIFLDVR